VSGERNDETSQLSEEERREVEREARLLFDVEDEILLEWEVHPLVSRRQTTIKMIIIALIAYTVAYFLFGAAGVVLSIAFTIFPSAPYIFPTRYVLTRKGVHLINWIARDRNSWLSYESYVLFPDAVQLIFSPRTLSGKLLRGNILFFNEDEDIQEQIVKIVSNYLDPAQSNDSENEDAANSQESNSE